MTTTTLNCGLAVLAHPSDSVASAVTFADADSAEAALERLGVAWRIVQEKGTGLFFICRRDDFAAWRLQREADYLGKLPAHERPRALALLRHRINQGNPDPANSDFAI